MEPFFYAGIPVFYVKLRVTFNSLEERQCYNIYFSFLVKKLCSKSLLLNEKALGKTCMYLMVFGKNCNDHISNF